MLVRKLITASFATTLFVLIFTLILPSPFKTPTNGAMEWLHNYVGHVLIYGTYALPVIFVYGIGTSSLVEWLLNKWQPSKRIWWAGVGHLFFGLVLGSVSLIAATFFWLIDEWLQRNQTIPLKRLVVLAIVIPLLVSAISLTLLHLLEAMYLSPYRGN